MNNIFGSNVYCARCRDWLVLSGHENCPDYAEENEKERELKMVLDLCERMCKSITGEDRHKRDAVDFPEELKEVKEKLKG